MSVDMSLVISRVSDLTGPCVYAGSESRKSTESTSKSSRNLRAALGNSVFLDSAIIPVPRFLTRLPSRKTAIAAKSCWSG